LSQGGLSEDGGGHSADSQNVNPNRKPAANINKRRGQKDLGINRPKCGNNSSQTLFNQSGVSRHLGTCHQELDTQTLYILV